MILPINRSLVGASGRGICLTLIRSGARNTPSRATIDAAAKLRGPVAHQKTEMLVVGGDLLDLD